MTLIRIPEALPKGRKEAPKPQTNTTASTATLDSLVSSTTVAVAMFTTCLIHASAIYMGTRGWFTSIPDISVWGNTYRNCAIFSGRLNPNCDCCTEMVEVVSIRIWTLIMETALSAVATNYLVHGWDRARRVGRHLFYVNLACFVMLLLFRGANISPEARAGVMCNIPSP
ncbi:hypothetical protein PG984_005196 [Apiospora sp. TS-2023a]